MTNYRKDMKESIILIAKSKDKGMVRKTHVHNKNIINIIYTNKANGWFEVLKNCATEHVHR